MYAIDVDFDVYEQLTVRRTTEDMTYNDVVRELLGLSSAIPKPHTNKDSDEPNGDWVIKGIRFPVGTEFRANHKGVIHTARVEGGAFVLNNGMRSDSPSPAAREVTGNSVNGWRFWEYRIPGKSTWQLIANLR